MSTRKTWAHEIAVRCKAVGWKVTNPRSLSGAYKITMSPCRNDLCNHMIQIHLSSSDINQERVVERELNAHGFAGLEKKAEADKLKERAAAIDADRRASAAKDLQSRRTDTLISKASGPYAGPEYVPNEWFVFPHPSPTFKWVILTPDQAKWLLTNCNTDNRPLRKMTVDHYMRVIMSDHWHLTHQGMAVDVRGVLQDGQHRLKAIEKAGRPVAVAFFAGMAEDNFKAIDEGLLRTAAQLLGKDGESNPKTLAAIVKITSAFQTAERARFKDKYTNEQIIDGFAGDREELAEACAYAVRNYRRAYLAPGSLGAARYLIRKANGADNPYVEGFFRGLVTSRKLDERFALETDDPRLRLRENVVNARRGNKRLSGLDQLCMTIIAWNYVVEDRRPSNLRFLSSSPIPRVTLLVQSDKLHVTAECPKLLRGEIAEPDRAELVAA